VAKEPRSVLEAYNALYLLEEVQMEGLVRNGAARSLPALRGVESRQRLARWTARRFERYLEILVAIGYRLEGFTSQARPCRD
jgi:hypothetical protein